MSGGKGQEGYNQSFAGAAGGYPGVDDVVVNAAGCGRDCPIQVASALDRAGGSITLAHTVEVLDASIRGDCLSQFTSLGG